jgi:hypothetical protein
MKLIEDKRTGLGPYRGSPREIEVDAREPFLLSECWDMGTPARWAVSMLMNYGGVALGLVLLLAVQSAPDPLRTIVLLFAALFVFSPTLSLALSRPVGLYWFAGLIERAIAGRALNANRAG